MNQEQPITEEISQENTDSDLDELFNDYKSGLKNMEKIKKEMDDLKKKK